MNKKLQYISLHPAQFKLDGGAMFGIIPKPMWSKQVPCDESNRIDLSLRCLLIITPHKKIIIDTGIGDYHNDKFNSMFAVTPGVHPLEESLKEQNFTCSDITDVVLSHLHFDHAGGLGRKDLQSDNGLLPTFPKATIHLHQKHYDYAKHPSERDSGSFIASAFMPMIDHSIAHHKMHFLNGEQGEILSDGDYQLNFKTSHGHTPWMIHPFDQTIIYLADIIPTSHHIHIPWVMGYDLSPAQTTSEKRALLDFIIEKKLTIVFEHDPLICAAQIYQDDKKNYRPCQVTQSQGKKSQLIFDF